MKIQFLIKKRVAFFKMLVVIVSLSTVLHCNNNGEAPAEQTVPPTEINDGGDYMETPITNTPKVPEKEAPKDPFSTNKGFEALKKSNANKTDFDFNFKYQEEVPTYERKDGALAFKLQGTLKTSVDLVDKASLSIEFYNNEKQSVVTRSPVATAELPFVKETEKKKSNDKILYRFDFQKELKLEAGRHYFLIVPTGRNRVLYTGTFLVQ